MKRIAIVGEDISRPVDEGFKKATAMLASALGELVPQTRVFTHTPERAALEAGTLPGNKLLWGTSFSRELAAFRPDAIVYIPAAAATPMSMVRARCLRSQSGGKPVVLISLQKRGYPGLLKPFLKAFRPDLVLVLSTKALDEVRGIGCRAGRIPLGVDSEVFSPPGPGAGKDLRARYGLPEGRIILHVGHLTPGRNLGILRGIAEENARVLVVTSTATTRHPEVEAVLQEPWAILIDKYIEHIEEIYRAVDGYVFPTFSTADAIDIPLSVLEAMSTNLPVAAADFGGLGDLFAAGDGLFLCSSDHEIVEAARRMLEIETVATRDKVLGLSWKNAAETILETIAVGLR